jgi:hypothetical protein
LHCRTHLGSPDAIALAKQLIQDKVSGNVHYRHLLCVGYNFVWFLVKNDISAVMNGERRRKITFALLFVNTFYSSPAPYGNSTLFRGLGDMRPTYTNFAFLVAHIPIFENFAL